jgi:pimeloyl-ACP methyl ester carboxylesterase
MKRSPLITIETENVLWKIRQTGKGKPLLLLHGFPDTPASFRHQEKAFTDAGYQLFVPYLPGYGKSTLNNDAVYYPGNFPQDLSALVQQLGYERVDFLGHDWGAFAGLMFAAEHPHQLNHLIVAAMPGFKGMNKGLLKQMVRSRYILQFQLRGLIDLWIRVNGLKKIDQLYRSWSPDWAFDKGDIEPVKQLLAQPGQLENALGYYRAAALRGSVDSSMRKTIKRTITVPTLSLIGENDGCIGAECFEGQEQGFSGIFESHTFPGAGHFMHLEKPDAFNRRVLEFLSK